MQVLLSVPIPVGKPKHFHVQEELSVEIAEAVPVVQRLVVGIEVAFVPSAEPQTPLAVTFTEQVAVAELSEFKESVTEKVEVYEPAVR